MKIRLVCLIMIVCLCLTGCWGKKELKSIGTVVAIAVDMMDSGEYMVNVFVLDTSLKKNTYKAVCVGGSKGSSIIGAIYGLKKYKTQSLEWDHCSVIIVGEKLAKKNMDSVVDFLSRNPHIRYNIKIFVSKGEAHKVLKEKSDKEDFSINSVTDAFENTAGSPSYYFVDFRTFFSNSTSKYCTNTTGYIKINDNTTKDNTKGKTSLNEAIIGGVCVFKENKFTQLLNNDDTLAYLLVSNELKDNVETIPLGKGSDDYISLTYQRPKAKIDVVKNGDNYSCEINIRIKAKIAEASNYVDKLNKKQELALIESFNEKIKKRVQSLIYKSKYYNDVDIFNINKIMYKWHNSDWNEMKYNWMQYYKKMPIKVVVNTEIISTKMGIK